MPQRGREAGDGWKQLPNEQLTPFARRIRDYLKDHWMNLADLRRAAGGRISVQAMLAWFYDGALPRGGTLDILADATGIPATQLQPLAERKQLLPPAVLAAMPGVIDRVIARFESDPVIDEVALQRAREILRDWRSLFEADLLDEARRNEDGDPDPGTEGPPGSYAHASG